MKRPRCSWPRLMAFIVALPLCAQTLYAQTGELSEFRPVVRRTPPAPVSGKTDDLARAREAAKRLAAAEKRAAADARFLAEIGRVFSKAKNLQLIDGKRRVAIVTTGSGNLAQAEDIAARLERAFPTGSLSARAYQLDGREAMGQVSAVVILHSSRSDFNVLRAYGATPGVLMISRRPQDLGVFGLVVLPGEVFVDEALMNGVQFVDREKPPTKLDLQTIDHLDQFIKARVATEKRGATVDWDEVIKLLRLAILKQPAEDGTQVPIAGFGHAPYVPHYFLSQALVKVGDCEAALAARRLSRSQARVTLKQATRNEIDALFRNQCHVSTEGGQWATASF